MAIVVSHNEIISKERIIVTYHPIGKKKKIYSLFCLKKSGGYLTKPAEEPLHGWSAGHSAAGIRSHKS